MTATKQDINEFVAIDEKSSHFWQEEILEHTILFVDEQQALNENTTSYEDEPMDDDSTS